MRKKNSSCYSTVASFPGPELRWHTSRRHRQKPSETSHSNTSPTGPTRIVKSQVFLRHIYSAYVHIINLLVAQPQQICFHIYKFVYLYFVIQFFFHAKQPQVHMHTCLHTHTRTAHGQNAPRPIQHNNRLTISAGIGKTNTKDGGQTEQTSRLSAVHFFPVSMSPLAQCTHIDKPSSKNIAFEKPRQDQDRKQRPHEVPTEVASSSTWHRAKQGTSRTLDTHGRLQRGHVASRNYRQTSICTDHFCFLLHWTALLGVQQ